MNDDPSPIPSDGSGVAPRAAGSPMPFEDLEQPKPVAPTPPESARWIAFVGVLVGGLLGALIGYGTMDILSDSELSIGLGTLVAAAIGAVGVGILASLTLRAMSEWKATQHPQEGLSDDS